MRPRLRAIRIWLGVVLGPTAHVENYSDEYALQRYRDMWDFYGSTIMNEWNAPNDAILRGEKRGFKIKIRIARVAQEVSAGKEKAQQSARQNRRCP